MSKWLRAAAVSHGVSLAAMEEASRFASKDADVEHLLLALVLDSGDAGEALRAAGVTLERARTAVVDERQAQLESLGLRGDVPSGHAIVFDETSGYELTDRATAVLNRAMGAGSTGDSAAVLVALLAEPSGVVRALLTRLGVDADALATRLRGVRVPDVVGAGGRRVGASSRTARKTFVPAPEHEVRALLLDAPSIPRWDSTFAAVTERDGRWEGRASEVGSDGRPVALSDRRGPQRIDRVTPEREDRIGWRFALVDDDTSNARIVVFATAPEGDGTRLTTEVRWETGVAGRRNRVVRRLLRPFQRLVLSMQVTQIGSGVSRAFR